MHTTALSFKLQSSEPQRTEMCPASRFCSEVLAPSQLLENHSPPYLLSTCMPRVSLMPRAELSVIHIWSVALPSIEIGLFGSVTSWMLALPVKLACLTKTPSDNSTLPLIL